LVVPVELVKTACRTKLYSINLNSQSSAGWITQQHLSLDHNSLAVFANLPSVVSFDYSNHDREAGASWVA
jgi:hypothetical protein